MARPILRTPICDMFGIEYPIFSAGMGGLISLAGPDLVAAVSNAGGLGVLGGAFIEPETLARQIDQIPHPSSTGA
ncbi:MAG: nitronate monooxygenase [Ardenticatenaceae bacterium]